MWFTGLALTSYAFFNPSPEEPQGLIDAEVSQQSDPLVVVQQDRSTKLMCPEGLLQVCLSTHLKVGELWGSRAKRRLYFMGMS